MDLKGVKEVLYRDNKGDLSQLFEIVGFRNLMLRKQVIEVYRYHNRSKIMYFLGKNNVL